MKGYLLLEDGSIYKGEINGESRNFLGNVSLCDEGIKVYCQLTSKYGFINSLNDVSSNLIIKDEDYEIIKKKLNKDKIIQGKIISDDLPIDYHLFDLKTYIPTR